MTRLLAQHSAFADAYAEQIGKAVAKVSTHADTLKWVAKAEGDVYLNVLKTEAKSPRNPAFCRALEIFSGGRAQALAKEDATDIENELYERPEYLTTIVLHPDGTWSECYLFRL